jgi:hypothetical protein
VTLDAWLQQFLTAHEAIAGSVHRRRDDGLVLAAFHNLPPPVVAKTQHIPKGKGMAGLAWERDQIVQTCDLKTDQTGNVQAGAKAVNAGAAAAIPVHDAGGNVRAIVGIAFAKERDLSQAELERFRRAAEALPEGDD